MRAKFMNEFEYGSSFTESSIYDELQWKMSKFLPDDYDLQKEFFSIVTDNDLSTKEKISEIIDFLNSHADMEILYNYMPGEGSLEEFADFLVKNP